MKINEVTKADEMNNEYRNVTNVKVKEIVTSINMIVDNKKWNEKTMQLMTIERNEHAKQTRKENAQAQCLLILLYSLNHNISRFRSRSDEQDLKSFKRLISSQRLQWISKQRSLLLISERF